MFRYFWGSTLLSVLALGGGAALGWYTTGTVAGALSILFICAVLAVLEVSLSFDNAVVNATVLEHMTPKWRRIFLTWGILIAVFGMRVVFPLLIVVIAAGLGPWEAIRLALEQPAEYERIVTGARVGVAGFGGAFLAMVGLKFFFNSDKEVHWIAVVERQLAKLARVESVAIAIVLACLFGVSLMLTVPQALELIVSGIFGLLTFIAVDALGTLLGGPEGGTQAVAGAARSGFASFMYLELLDASFSFDGVIGAFALTNNLIVIALGLGIGAVFVRSMTIYLVEKGTLAAFRYLEHGAFWAILVLAAIMLVGARYHVPEVVTGLAGATLIAISFLWSLRYNKKNPDEAHIALVGGPTGDGIEVAVTPEETREVVR